MEWIEIDITDDSALEALVADLYLRYGKIDVLINNAGYGNFLKISTRFLIKIFTRCLRVNTFALMNLSRRSWSPHEENRKGHIINIVSMAGLIATSKSSLYSATKFCGYWIFKRFAPRTDDLWYLCNNSQSRTNRTGFFDQAGPRWELPQVG